MSGSWLSCLTQTSPISANLVRRGRLYHRTMPAHAGDRAAGACRAETGETAARRTAPEGLRSQAAATATSH